jgi:hypothetical protein
MARVSLAKEVFSSWAGNPQKYSDYKQRMLGYYL